MSTLVQTQLNSMFRNSNKQIYEIEAQINDIYYGKAISGGSSSSSRGDFMSSNYGYQENKGQSKFQDSQDAQMQFLSTKIDSIKMHFEDLEGFFLKNKGDLGNDQQFYWTKKLDDLKKKTGGLN